jgi:hypothetical protein
VRNRFLISLLVLFFIATKILADTTSVATDSADKPFIPPNQGPLGIDISTGLALYGMAILFAILILALWRKNIVNSRKNSQVI